MGLARFYDPMLSLPERWWLARRRRELLASVDGRILEVGAGTGANLRHYPPGVDLVVSEPDAGMRAVLEGRLGAGTRCSDAAAESLPFAEASFDTVVATLVLCSVRDPLAALREIRRVLVPGGRFLFLEHTASDGWIGGLQRALDPVWIRAAAGCHLRRDPLRLLEELGFVVVDPAIDRPWVLPPFLHPIVSGSAVAPRGAQLARADATAPR